MRKEGVDEREAGQLNFVVSVTVGAPVIEQRVDIEWFITVQRPSVKGHFLFVMFAIMCLLFRGGGCERQLFQCR